MLIYFLERLFPCIVLNEEFYPKKIERINSSGTFVEYKSDND